MKAAVTEDSRVPFDPTLMRSCLAGCLLCGGSVAVVGIFIPWTDEMRCAVLRLRTRAVVPGSVPSLAYGLCRDHAADLSAPDQVEAAIVTAAAKVAVQ